MKTILYANTIDYNFALQQRPHHLMNILSQRGYNIHWVNQTQQQGKGKDVVSDNITVYHNWDVYKKRNPKVDIYFSSWSARYRDLDQIESDLVIYDSLDNFEANEKEEHIMVSKADIVLTTSQPLYDLRIKEHNNVYMCRNGCFSELGSRTYDIPEDLKPYMNKPIILFSGALADWCDLELVERIAKRYQLVVVGKPWNLKAMPKGIIYLGQKTYLQLQAYYQHCTVSILPFLQNSQIAYYSNPIKNYEAMSHGKITVATEIPETVIYPDVVFIGNTHDKFIRRLDDAIKLADNKDMINKCKYFAQLNDWSNRVDVIQIAINNIK